MKLGAWALLEAALRAWTSLGALVRPLEVMNGVGNCAVTALSCHTRQLVQRC